MDENNEKEFVGIEEPTQPDPPDPAPQMSIKSFKRTSQSVDDSTTEIELAKAARIVRQSRLLGHHMHVIDLAAMLLNATVEVIIDGLIDTEEYVKVLESLFEVGGKLGVMICYGKGFNETQPRVTCSDGFNEPLTGDCAVFYRLTNVNLIDTRNVCEEIHSALIPQYSNYLAAVWNVLMDHNYPVLLTHRDWGELNKSDEGVGVRESFLKDYKFFFETLNVMRTTLDECLTFEIDPRLCDDLRDEQNVNADVYVKVRELVGQWTRKLQLMVVRFDQIRFQNNTMGPLHEVDYWRCQAILFEQIALHLRSDECAICILVLERSKCPLLKKWNRLNDQIRDIRVIIRDNLKYMNALVPYVMPLYRYDPKNVKEFLPGIFEVIRNIYQSSRFFHTNECISALIKKVTHQLVITCRNYLTNNYTQTIWEQDHVDVLSKIRTCLDLYMAYYSAYEKTQMEMTMNETEPFQCSHSYIFGTFERFKERVEKISDVFEDFRKFRILELSHLEGIDVYAARINQAYALISSKKYDVVNFRGSEEFDADFKRFEKSCLEVENDLYMFVKDSLRKCRGVDNCLRLLERFEKINFPCLDLHNRYIEVFDMFRAEIDRLIYLYNEQRADPPIPWNHPPISGRISWARHLYSRIDGPMKIFRQKPRILKDPASQKCIRKYNALSMILVHYEKIYHDVWFDGCEQVRLVLQEPLLVKIPKVQKMSVNFDRYIFETVEESKRILALAKPLPTIAGILLLEYEKIYRHRSTVQELVEKNDQIRRMIPKVLLTLMKPQLMRMDEAFKPARSYLTWTSLGVEDYCQETAGFLEDVEKVVKEVSDLKSARIDEPLGSFDALTLLKLSEDPQDIEDILQTNRDHSARVAVELEKKSRSAELASVELINRLLDVVDDPEFQNGKYEWLRGDNAVKCSGSLTKFNKISGDYAFSDFEPTLMLAQIHTDCTDLFVYFNNRVVNHLLKLTRVSLELLKVRTFERETTAEGVSLNKPLFLAWMELLIPKFVMKPSIEELQQKYNELIEVALRVHERVVVWGQRGGSKPITDEEDLAEDGETGEGLMSYYEPINEHKEVLSITSSLIYSLLTFKSEIHEFLHSFDGYAYLWDENRAEIVQKFADSEPIHAEIHEKFREYTGIVEEIAGIAETKIVGPICIRTERAKLSLTVEANAWKTLLAHSLMTIYRTRVTAHLTFIADQTKVLNQKINDLDDVRLIMAALSAIRQNFIEMDLGLDSLEQSYVLLQKLEVDVPVEDVENVQVLRKEFTEMLDLAKEKTAEIVEVQDPFREKLIEEVKVFQKEVEDFDEDFELNGPMIEGIPAREASDRVMVFQARFDEILHKYEVYSSGEQLFGIECHEYPVIDKRRREFNLLNKLYSLYLLVNKRIDSYFDIPWSRVDIDAITTELTDFQNRCKRLPKGMREWPAYLDLKRKIDDFSESCELLEMMASKSMKDRHWKLLEKLLDCEFDVESETFLLRDVMEAPLLKYRLDVEDICVGAVKERDIEAKLRQVIADWQLQFLQFTQFKSRGELLVKAAEVGETIALLEDSLMILNSLVTNRYNTPFKKEIQLWIQKLSNSSDILERWIQVQSLWMYLEAVFVGGDISKQLPQEAKRFIGIDKTWVRIMARARDNPNVIDCCVGDDTMTRLLPYLLEQLETCQKSLSGYLEIKRKIFPRFYFISDPVLLEILGQSSNPASIKPHLLSLFDALDAVEFNPDRPGEIVAILSTLRERILLETPVLCVGGVENWLNILLTSMREVISSIIAVIAQLVSNPNFDFITAYVDHPGQAGLLGLQILWTKDCEFALIKSKVDKTIMRATNKKFLDLLNQLIDVTTKELTRMDRIQVETMITIHLHQRDIFDDLVKMKIRTPLDFEWQKQSRFYYVEDNDDCWVKITDVNFLYQNEYLGITERLCITPLTDRCYITLAQAIGMNMGGAPAGPAGTGKTETTKDMGRALGKFVVVFNCSDQMDFRGLGRIFKGLAQSGTWGCFDEFNRIDLPVLSVAAQQISIVLTARKERKANFVFSDGDDVVMNPELGIFLTMNPGYAGRQELPENLKIQFRSVAMMVPDRQIIIRVKLASCGFKENIVLSRKFYTLYALCEEQLSKQVHYDFGLRNILSVLRTLGAQKRKNPNDTEETIVFRVLREMNVSKLIDEDEPLFLSLCDDMFPGIRLTTADNANLQKAIANQTAQMGLINHPDWNLKVVQLYDTYLVRHGLMTLGPTGSGKTTSNHCLQRCFTEMGREHREMRMNPKAITASQMFGKLDVATNDWTDGIFSTLWRRSLKTKPNEFIMLVLDGPVDAVWIENLNSVLDDNKTLTLANGDRIVMGANCKLCFEPDNVDNASPATVSRMGMVFISSSVLPWKPLVQGWLLKRSPMEASVLMPLFEAIFGDLHLFVQSRLTPKMCLLEALYVRQCCELLTVLMDAEDGLTAQTCEKLFLFAIMWSLGAVLELDDRVKWQEYVLTHPSKLLWPKCKENETIFEYCVRDGQWTHWSTLVEDYVYPRDSIPDYGGILVPNVDNVRTNYLIGMLTKQLKPVLLIGEQGTAKTVMMKELLQSYDVEAQLSKSFNFSSATTPNMVQRTIESYVEKRVGTTYGPPGQRKMTVFIDDINMPDINDWGDQITNEIVRQLMETGGFYSLDKPGDFLSIIDVLVVGAMIHPGGGRNDIPARLKRQFCVFNCTLPSDSSMDKIFSAIGTGYFCSERFNETVVEFIPKIIPLTRQIWQQTKIKMLPTPAKFHYVFNLRDLSRIWQGMLTIQSEACQDIAMVLKLWHHECQRVISDRFINADDREWFLKNLATTSEGFLGDLYENFPEESTYFVDFLREPPEPTGDEPDDFCFDAPKVYEEWPSRKFVLDKVHEFMEQFNETYRSASMDLVFFQDALMHLMIISRILRTSRGNAMLVGVGGSGKQSLTKLASFIAGYDFHQITLTRSYNVNNFLEDFKFLYRVAGLKGRGITFIFTDNDIKDESFLEYINNVLNSGEIANLFPKDELDEITGELVPVMKKVDPKRPPTVDNLYDFFIQRSCANLHIALCFSPIGEKFRNRTLKFPGLISGCTIDWFSKWPIEALVAVSNHILKDFPVVCPEEVKKNMIETTGQVHEIVGDACVSYFERFRRQVFVTPKSFLSFLETYCSIYTDKHDHIRSMADKMITGLDKLVEAAASVDVLRLELVEKEKEIQVVSAKAEEVLKTVDAAKEIAEAIKTEAMSTKETAESLVRDISYDQAIAEEKLEVARPALEQAEAALQTIKATDISTVRKLAKPPYLITWIMDAVLILFRKHLEPVRIDEEKAFLVPSWPESLRVMADSKFLANLQQYPKDTINGEIVDLLHPYLRNPLYTFANAKQACGNVAGLLQWTAAMSSFYSVNKDVLPLKANLAVQRARYEAADRELKAALSLLAEKEAEVYACQVVYDKAMASYQAVADEAQICKDKMNAATDLIEGLSGEKIRWTEQSKLFKSEIDRLVGDVLVLCGFLGYTGPFNQEFRSFLLGKWIGEIVKLKIPMTRDIGIIDQLADTATISEWNIQGLPNDDLSIQNGIIVTKSFRYPLLIDPQGQGKIWIKNKEANNNLVITSLNNKYFRQHFEDCVSLGYPIILEDVMEELDPALDNILERKYVKVGNSYKVKFGDKEIDVSKDFRAYITTKLSNPTYTPEISARTSIIDFTVTMKGLEDQLLGRVILSEKKELEEERNQLNLGVIVNQRKMKELEDNLLSKLTSTQGSLVDDITVIQVLNVTKETAADVKMKLEVAKETEVKINAAREEFRLVAARGSVLYFLIVSMAEVNCMYQTSLNQFLERFDLSLERSEKSFATQKRIGFILHYLTLEIFKYKSRGLYEEHKFMFVLLMTLKIDLQLKKITYEEFQYFVKGGAALNLKSCPSKPAKWINDMTWLNLVELNNLKNFTLILNQVQGGVKQWKEWVDKDMPEEYAIPFYENAEVFRKLLIIRAWCPDRIIAQSRKYITDSLGAIFAEPIIVNYDLLLNESRAMTPLICFLSMGSDPTPNIEMLAKKNDIPLTAISMGQGQEVHARKLVAQSLQEGSWILLQNCHLGLTYMSELLGELLETEKTGKFHDQFRIWLTSEVNPEFPIALLQICIKFTNEPPSGMRAGLKRTYSTMSQDMLDHSSLPQYVPLIFAVSFLHTVVQERRKFGPLGWNIPYEFNSADWLASCMFIQNHLDEFDAARGISWTTIRYMLSEVQYGGRVTDDFDKLVLNKLCQVWFSETVFDDDFTFYTGYNVLQYKYINEYIAAIDQMENVDPPQVYGLHSNADITYQSKMAINMLDITLSIQPKESSGTGGETREAAVARQAKEMLEKTPLLYDPFEVKERLKIMGHLLPMNIFLRQEIDRMQRVISLVRSTLNDLLLAIEGTIIMNEALRDALDNIYNAKIPALWLRYSWESSTIGFWFTEFIERNGQFATWLMTGRPHVFWMTGFFNPQGFLTAMRQEITRAHKGWALDAVVLHNEVTRLFKGDIHYAPPEGVYIHGLYLDGAGWNRRDIKLVEATPKVLYTQLPVILISASNTAVKDPKLYAVPVYKKPKRTGLTYITSLWLPSNIPPEHWVLRGVALLCDVK